MDSQVPRDGKLLIDVVDDDWLAEIIGPDDISVPLAEVPDPEPDSGQSAEDSARELERKWLDNALSRLASIAVARGAVPAVSTTGV